WRSGKALRRPTTTARNPAGPRSPWAPTYSGPTRASMAARSPSLKVANRVRTFCLLSSWVSWEGLFMVVLLVEGWAQPQATSAAALAPALARALRDLDQAVHGQGFDPATTDRELTLALADVIQVVKLPAIVRALGTRMPRVRLRVLSIDALVASGGLGGTAV